MQKCLKRDVIGIHAEATQIKVHSLTHYPLAPLIHWVRGCDVAWFFFCISTRCNFLHPPLSGRRALRSFLRTSHQVFLGLPRNLHPPTSKEQTLPIHDVLLWTRPNHHYGEVMKSCWVDGGNEQNMRKEFPIFSTTASPPHKKKPFFRKLIKYNFEISYLICQCFSPDFMFTLCCLLTSNWIQSKWLVIIPLFVWRVISADKKLSVWYHLCYWMWNQAIRYQIIYSIVNNSGFAQSWQIIAFLQNP